MKRFVALTALLLTSFSCVQAQQVPAPEPVDLDASTLVTNLQSDKITEGSGLAASRRYPGLFYVNNDSGDTAHVFLINTQGATVATIKVNGAYARDWEDITFAGDYLYIGDIGDNLAIRDAVQVYRFKEPELDPQKLDQTVEVTPEVVALRMPGTPRNAETLLAAPDGRIWIVSKDEGGSFVFAAQFKAGQTESLKKVGEKIQFGATGMFTKLATGGDFSGDGTKLCIVTYAQLYEWKLPAPFDVSGLAKLPANIRALSGLKQCESVCYTPDGTKILVSTEGKKPPIYSFVSSF
jgi:hypothetical protein